MQVPNRFESIDDYRYGFNGMEKDDEIKGEGNSYDFGARMYDPRVGRWFTRDAKDYKYPSFSPYNFAINSPIIVIDIDGQDIFIPISTNKRDYKYSKYDHLKNVGIDNNKVGFKPFTEHDVDKILKDVQKLTNEKLTLKPVYNNNVKIGYRVEIVTGEKVNEEYEYNEGTKLVRDLISDKKHTVSITKSEDRNSIAYHPNGNSVIMYNPDREANDPNSGILNSDGSYGRPPFIGLTHEMIHGDNHRNNLITTEKEDVYNPDATPFSPKYNEKVKVGIEELNTRDRENIIREEHKNDEIPVKQRENARTFEPKNKKK